ncbi:MAG: LapA family protein [Rhodoferax sp.]|nr:LapA family protein [Rhodoferax sp.]
MKQVAWLFKWLLKAAIFFTLLAFALNNQHDATVHFFFGTRWTAPMVLVVLGAFSSGLLLGIVGMVPRWWRQRAAAQQARNDVLMVRKAAPPTAQAANALIDIPPHGL